MFVFQAYNASVDRIGNYGRELISVTVLAVSLAMDSNYELAVIIIGME